MNLRALLWLLAVGAAFGTSKAGIGIAGLGQFKPELIMKVRPVSTNPVIRNAYNPST